MFLAGVECKKGNRQKTGEGSEGKTGEEANQEEQLTGPQGRV